MAILDDADEIFLHPGEYRVGDAHCRIRTLLGSCVAVTLWHRKRRVGAMSHFLLPANDSGASAPPNAMYGNEAIDLMLKALAALQVPGAECEAKIFGGGNMFPSVPQCADINIGRKNGETARRLLRERGIAIVSENLFGIGHREVIFDIGTGDVWARKGKIIDMPFQERQVRT